VVVPDIAEEGSGALFGTDRPAARIMGRFVFPLITGKERHDPVDRRAGEILPSCTSLAGVWLAGAWFPPVRNQPGYPLVADERPVPAILVSTACYPLMFLWAYGGSPRRTGEYQSGVPDEEGDGS